MTLSTQIIGNKEVTVRFFNQEEQRFLDMEQIDFNKAFYQIKGNYNFGINQTSGSVGNFEFTTLTNKELEDNFIKF